MLGILKEKNNWKKKPESNKEHFHKLNNENQNLKVESNEMIYA